LTPSASLRASSEPRFLTPSLKTGFGAAERVNLTADQFDVKVINDAPFTFLNRIFKEGNLLIDLDPDLRTDLIEHVSLKYRECAGLLAEASLG
jgi:hypothetical protein